jgi:hypothetical protein
MEWGQFIVSLLAFFGMGGSLWYKMGYLSKQVEQHNQMLSNIQKQIEHLLIR